jgi:hypothetical protein
MLVSLLIAASINSQPLAYHVTAELDLPFLLEGVRIKSGFEEPVDPLEAVEKLYLVADGKARRLKQLSELRLQVSIKDEETALQFVRLRTSPESFHMFDPPTLEVQAKERVDARFTLGDTDLAKRLQSTSVGPLAIYDQHLLDELGLGPAIVERKGGGFLVSRWVVEAVPSFGGRALLYRLKESVGADGAYTVAEKKMAPEPLQRAVYWSIMRFE